MSKWVDKLTENALGIDQTLMDWSGLECDCCDARATHVEVGVDDAKNHSDVVILRALCDECFEDSVLSSCWMHKE